MQIYSARGNRHTYAFSIDDDVPLQKMYKNKLTRMYFPAAASNHSAGERPHYQLTRACQPSD